MKAPSSKPRDLYADGGFGQEILFKVSWFLLVIEFAKEFTQICLTGKQRNGLTSEPQTGPWFNGVSEDLRIQILRHTLGMIHLSNEKKSPWLFKVYRG